MKKCPYCHRTYADDAAPMLCGMGTGAPCKPVPWDEDGKVTAEPSEPKSNSPAPAKK